jgi:hypothetical protein
MPIPSRRAGKLLTASVFAAAVAVAPAAAFLSVPPTAHAAPVPDPGPAPEPQPAIDSPSTAACQSGETLDASTGNCIPTMTPIVTDNGDQPVPLTPPPRTGDTTSTSYTGEPADLVPNINGDPCTGYWESTVCLTENAPAVRPHSTLSTSP